MVLFDSAAFRSAAMKFLFCCEFYYPSVGGVQEVMKQIAERLVARGHEVTVATTALPNRDFTSLNGVQIAQFAVSGNLLIVSKTSEDPVVVDT